MTDIGLDAQDKALIRANSAAVTMQPVRAPSSAAAMVHGLIHAGPVPTAFARPRLPLPVIYRLMKPRVMYLVVFTALAGLFAAPGQIGILQGLVAIAAIAAGAGASGALNMWYDADIDAVMARTAQRGIPSGQISAEDTLSFGIVLSVASVIVLTLATNLVAGGLLAFTIFYYIAIYTMWLKRRTPQNIVIGGAAGAFPPMIGWAAVTGSITLESIVLFLIIFMWTPPHFWALALVKCADYEAAGVPMLPNVKGETETRKQILIYTILLAPLPLLPVLMGFAGITTLATGVVGGAAMLWWAIEVFRRREGKPATKAAWKLFGGSIVYLFAVFAALICDRLIVMWQMS